MPGLLQFVTRNRRRAVSGAIVVAFASCAHTALRPGDIAPAPDAAAAVPAPPSLPTPPPLVREFRGVWITPVEGGDWPSRPGLTTDEQKQELTAVLDRAKAVGLNAVIFHVRTGADALYPSEREPWSKYLSGELGIPPSPLYDPVALAVHEAHARGLQFHAWFNPFRVTSPMALARVTSQHIATRHPEWVVRYGDQLWIDPGIPAARRAVLNAILEVVDKYDIDAVHLDDYFYPYLEQQTLHKRVKRGHRWRRVSYRETIRFPDAASWREYGDGWDSKADWRRANIDTFIQQLYREVKAHKRWVQVGISPFGIWRPGYPDGITGLDAYNEIFADSRKWLREGWLDYIAPQLYWQVDGTQSRLTRLDRWWMSQNRLNRHVWPGLFTAGAASRSGDWPASDILEAVDTLRALHRREGQSLGAIHFRMRSLFTGAPGRVGDLLARSTYAETAIPPAFPWLGSAVPAPPRVGGDSAALGFVARARSAVGAAAAAWKGTPAVVVTPGDAVPVRWWAVQVRDLYGHWSTSLRPGSDREITLAAPDGSAPTAAAISALSNTGVASAPRIVQPGTAQ